MINLFAALCLFPLGEAVSRHKFRTCSQTGFCRRNRDTSIFYSQEYEVRASSVKCEDSVFTAEIQNTKHPKQTPLDLSVVILKDGTAWIKVNERNPLHKRFEVEDVLVDLKPHRTASWTCGANEARAVFDKNELVVTYKEFQALLSVNGQPAVRLNQQGKMNFEVYRNERNPKPEPQQVSSENDSVPVPPPILSELALKFPYDVDGTWEESFDGHSDSKPRGPSAVAIDATFVGSKHVYGIPEHASSFALKTTKGAPGYDDPYRLFNLDVFEYELDNPMALYGSVPFVISHDAAKTVGMLWLNAAETFVDIADLAEGKNVHWISESGIIEVFLLPGPTPANIFHQYATLTGFASLPPRFAVGYHQCRWNYKDEADVRQVDGGFDEHDIPYDVLWLDIEHTDGKKYFTWDNIAFPNPKQMIDDVAAKGRKMVTIVDPHIKRDSNYHVHQQALDKDYYVKNAPSKGGVYEGHCWPGSVSYPDFSLPSVRDYWASLFALDKYQGSTQDLFIWNDMNEPSVFNGPEVTMPKDCVHRNGQVEHREIHNMYGFYYHMATHDGLLKRDNARPFVLSRSFFAGSQRFGAVWTGDNTAAWSHLGAATPMLLSLSVGAITFSGADVGGFFGDPEPELLLRWYQSAAFTPFFRGHAHIDTKRREPWLHGKEMTDLIRIAIRNRYAFLPYVYTLFYQTHTTGVPILRPLWAEFPSDEATFAMDNQFMLGNAILVHPITQKGVDSERVYLPAGDWYCLHTFNKYTGAQEVTVPVGIHMIPVFQRGGTIVPKRERARRSSKAMDYDPFTLVVAVDSATGSATGTLYLDDGRSFDYQTGAYIYREFSFNNNVLTSRAKASTTSPNSATSAKYTSGVTVERVLIAGLSSDQHAQFTKAQVVEALPVGSNSRSLNTAPREVMVFSSRQHLVVRKPDCRIDSDWTITLQA